MHQQVELSHNWWYCEKSSREHLDDDQNLSGFEAITLPHTKKMLPYNYFDEKSYQTISTYKRIIEVRPEQLGQRAFVEFEGVMLAAEVYMNGQYVMSHKGGYTPFTAEITSCLKAGPNMLTVIVDSTERKDIPPFGNVADYLAYGGIYREVSLKWKEDCYIKDVFVHCSNPLDSQKNIAVSLQFDNRMKKTDFELQVSICREGNVYHVCRENISLKQGDDTKEILIPNVTGLQNWDLDHPVLYDITVDLFDGEEIDSYSVKTGFRKAEFTKDGFYLNGCKQNIRGLNRHQSFPHAGYAVSKRAQYKDADILKYELGLNLVRTSHYPQSRHFHDRCDEIGLLVFEELPGWQYIGDEEWKQNALQSVEEMIIRDRNRPSVILWGVRINESMDDHDFYIRTNALARKLDPTRQTGGVRWIEHSELLEDVYTINDFIYKGDNEYIREPRRVTGTEDYVPYLITEFGGHMYPTKRYDQEERLVEHALWHAGIQNQAALDEHISGAIGWCAFDYNTHYQFGSGDRICYHGVMDMFRLPKFAGHFYASQRDVKYGFVLEPATHWAFGERAIGGVSPLVIFTNCDYVELYIAGSFTGKYYPRKETYEGLPHPPVIIEHIEGVWGGHWHDAEFIGYIGDKAVCQRKVCKNPIPAGIIVEPDDRILLADGMDTTRVVVKAIDQVGNVLPFLFEPITIEIAGAADLIGPKVVALQGGVYAFWIRTKQQAGEIQISVSNDLLGKQLVTIKTESNIL